jgi:hypothetical protein
MRGLWLALAAGVFALPVQGEPGSMLRVDFSNPALTPSKWTLVIHADGSAHFHSDAGAIAPKDVQTIEPLSVDKDVRLSEDYTDRVFQLVRKHHELLDDSCESHMKVAFQGWKKLSYAGPEGNGSCEFNYSKDKDIQGLGESFVAVASTILEGARLELLLQHDPLGLDKEMQYLQDATGDGRVQQLCAIRGILEKLEEDPAVMERVRKRARTLLAQDSK